MKVHQIICPKCKSSLSSKAGIEEGTSIACPKCKNKFAVAPPEDDEVVEDFEVVDDDEEEEAPKKPAAKPASKPALKPISKQRPAAEEDDDDEEEEAPKKPAAKPASKPALKPISKQRPAAEEDEEDEEEETPRKSAAKTSLKPLSKQRRSGEDDDDGEEEAPKKSAAKSTLKPLSKRKGDDDRPGKASGAFDDMDDDEKPARNKKRVVDDDDDDDDDKPRSKRRSRDEDDDDDDRPRRRGRRDDDDDEPKSGFAKLKANIYVRVSVLVVLVGVMGVLGYMLYEKRKKANETVEKKEDDPDDPSKPVIIDPRKPGDPPKPGVRHAGTGRMAFQAQGFSFMKPANWQVAKAQPGMFANFTGPPTFPGLNLGIISQPYDNTPFEQLSAQVKMFLPMQIPSVKFEQEGAVPIDGQQAYFMVYSMRVPAGSKEIEVKTMQFFILGRAKQKAFILTFADQSSTFNSNRKLFEETAASVQAD